MLRLTTDSQVLGMPGREDVTTFLRRLRKSGT
jgi:hypothetical protein